ncbi:hypothetical protein F4814DRAFT_402598 [Daldinia grandis]|nr:hypothetical protein F4814DRAFT_402598 [Daldinia grandis]
MQSQRRKKACKECRTHKIKCSAEPPEICSRCRRLGLPCILTSDARSRRTKAQLQRELEALKGLTSQPTSQSVDDHNSTTAYTLSQDQANGDALAFIGPSSSLSNEVTTITSLNNPCLPRVLDGWELGSVKINDCFKL